MEKLEVNQRIELFEILSDGGYDGGAFTIGTFRPGKVNQSGNINVLAEDNFNDVLSMALNREVRPVGAMVVKKLKTKFPNIADGSLGPKVRPISKYII